MIPARTGGARTWSTACRGPGAALAMLLLTLASDLPAGEDPPAGFKRYLPRGRIPAQDEPRFVPAAEADVPADAWVLGVVVDGQARAYELNLLTRREVVNDQVGDHPIAAVWCPLSNAVAVYDRRIAGRELRFEPSGVLMHGSIVLQDKETDSFWPILQGQAMYGSLKGTPLPRLPGAVKARYGEWVRQHPDTLVWSLHGQEHLDQNPMARYLASSVGFRGMVAEDKRLQTKDPVFGFEIVGRVYAAAAADLEGGRVFAVAGEWVLLHREVGADLNDPTRAFVSPSGYTREGDTWVDKDTGVRFDTASGVFSGPRGPRALLGFDTFWYVWSLNYPGTELLGR